jgi:DNA-nicking Smr family endonuclease
MDQVFDQIDDIPDKDLEALLAEQPRKEAPKPKSSVAKNPFRSHVEPDDVLDLHGKTRDEALMLVENFVHYGVLHGAQTLLIITGKGYRSGKGGPVLRPTIEAWLRDQGKKRIQRVQEAPPRHGGSGALWVTLRG